MEIAYKLIYTVAIFFVVMLPGVIMKKCKLSTDGLGKGLSNLVLYIAQPALILRSYLREYDGRILKNMLYVFLFSVVTHAIFTVVTMLLFKGAEDSKRRMLRFAVIFSNAAFMGMPLIAAVINEEALIYASIYNITFNAWLWTLGVYICAGGRDADCGADNGTAGKAKSAVSVKKALMHPTMIAAALGLVCFFLSFDAGQENLPTAVKFLVEVIDMLKALVAPLSMIVLGLRLADMDLRGFFKDKYVYLCLLLRHIVLPVAVFAVMRVFSLFLDLHIDVITSILIMASAPVATSATMFAEKYDCDSAYVSKIVAVSTIISIVTMPLVSLLTMI